MMTGMTGVSHPWYPLAVFSLLGAGFLMGAEQPWQQVLFDFESQPSGWTTNVWGGPGEMELGPSLSPKFGTGSLRSMLKGVVKAGNTISPWLPADAPWRAWEWGAISLWFKGDGSPTHAVLRVQTGEGERVAQDYSCDLPMDSRDWRRLVLPVDSFWNRGHVPMDARCIIRCYVGHRGDGEFEVDQIALEAPSRPVPLIRVTGDAGAGMAPSLIQLGGGRHGLRFDPSPCLPGSATFEALFQGAETRFAAEETVRGERPAGECLLLAPAGLEEGPVLLRLEVKRARNPESASWRFDAIEGRPLPEPTRLGLLPAPKECLLGQGALALAEGMVLEARGAEAASAARLLAEELSQTGLKLTLRTQDRTEGQPLCVSLAEGCEASAAALRRLPDLPAGGYLIDAGERGASIRARDAEGVRNGVLTLAQAAESQWALTGIHAVPALRVVDWPSLPWRAVSLSLPCGRWGHPNDPPADPDAFLRFAREVMLRTKMNLAVLIVEQAMRYESHPEVAGPAAWTPGEVKRVFETLRDWGVEPVPCLNSLGHMNWLCISHRELAEDGDVHQICTTHPQAWPMVRSLYQEIIDLVRPRYFHAGFDEIRWKTGSLPAAQRCPRCAGKSKQDLFAAWVAQVHGFLRQQDIRMMMWGDMLLPGHNGGPPYQLAATVDRLPKDIIVANWSTRTVPDSTAWLREQGFAQIIKSNSGGATLAEQPGIAGNMLGCWYKVPWLVEGTEAKMEQYAYGAFLQAAEYSWNHWTGLFNPLPKLAPGFFGDRPLVQMRMGAAPVAAGMRVAVPLPGAGEVPGLPSGAVGFGHVRFLVQGGLELEPGREVTIPVERSLATAYLLHAARLLDRAAMIEATKRKESWQGVPIAEYEVRHASGAREMIPVRYSMEVRDPEPGWCEVPLAFGSMGVSPATAASDGLHLYAQQWRNPRPEDPVEDIVLRPAEPAARLVLAGLLVQEAAGPGEKSPPRSGRE